MKNESEWKRIFGFDIFTFQGLFHFGVWAYDFKQARKKLIKELKECGLNQNMYNAKHWVTLNNRFKTYSTYPYETSDNSTSWKLRNKKRSQRAQMLKTKKERQCLQ